MGFLFLSDSFRHPVEFATCACDPGLQLFLLLAIHLRQSLGEPPVSSTQDGPRHLQFAIEGHRGRLGDRRLPLRFQKQFRLGEDALADHARAVPPSRIELPSLPCIAMVLDEGGGHPRAVLHVDPRHRHQILHRQLRSQRSFAHLLLNLFR